MNPLSFTSHNWLAHAINNASLRRHQAVLAGRVLDLGCGDAPYEADIVDLGCTYVGVDWPKSLHGRQRVAVFADLGGTIPFRDRAFDTVTSFQVLEHLPEPALFLRECRRVLAPGGALLLTVPFQWREHEAPHDYYRFTRFGLERLLRAAGFTEVLVEANTGYWQTMVLKGNYWSLRFAKGPLRYLWMPLWFVRQVIAPLVDRVLPSPEETASYTVVAR